MHDFMAWMEASALGQVMRGTGLWTYAIVNLCHILGVATLFGAVVIMDLRLIGVWRRTPLAALASAVVPVATCGFLVAAITGTGLLATKATEYTDNPFLYIKFSAIALGLLNACVLNLLSAWRERDRRELSRLETRRLAVVGVVSLTCWLAAVTAGRMIAYW